ncbi:MAG: hypothetical protein ACRD5G_00990 [Candidatus Acidiferrales bacterium]
MATELYIALDADFNPIEDGVPDAKHPGSGQTQNAAYEGTLDLVLLDSGTDPEIDDCKSYYQIIDPDCLGLRVEFAGGEDTKDGSLRSG